MDNHDKWATESANDLFEKPKQSVVVAGSHLPSSVHLLTYKINQVLEINPHVLSILRLIMLLETFHHFVNRLRKEIETIIFLGGNPVYHCPSVDWVDLLKSAKNKYRLGHSIDETSQVCDFHIGQSHFLESWDIGNNWSEDICSPVQPIIAPLFDTCSDTEILSSLLGESKNSTTFCLNFSNPKPAYQRSLKIS